MAECRGLAPLARRHALVSTEARFACPVGIPKNGPRGRSRTCNLPVLSGTPLLIGLHADGAPGRICTDTERGLSPPPLPWATGANWCRVREFHPQPLRSERSASGSWANAAKWHSRQESHLQPGGSKPPALIV